MSFEAQSLVTFILGAAGTLAALWFLFLSYREAPELRGYLRYAGM